MGAVPLGYGPGPLRGKDHRTILLVQAKSWYGSVLFPMGQLDALEKLTGNEVQVWLPLSKQLSGLHKGQPPGSCTLGLGRRRLSAQVSQAQGWGSKQGRQKAPEQPPRIQRSQKQQHCSWCWAENQNPRAYMGN